MHSFKEFLSRIYPVKDETLDEYVSRWKEYSTPRRTIVTAPGDTERYIYYVLEGVQKSYYQSEDKQHIITFAYAPSFSGVLESFFNQKPSRYFLENITPCSFLRLSYQEHEEMLDACPELNILFRKISERFLDGVIQRQHELMALSMEERFKVFVQRSPHLLQLISQKDLASYLRMDATNFSKLMNSIRI